MDHESLHQFCLSFYKATDSMPFGPNAVVFKVENKMFALLSLSSASMNLKCDPEIATQLRADYQCVIPGFHMNKKHWNTIHFEEHDCSEELLHKWIKDSYFLVVNGLPKKTKNPILANYNHL